MKKISLQVDIKEKFLLSKITSKVIRLKTYVIFPTKVPRQFITRQTIVHTGGPISVIPKWIWKNLNVAIIEECSLTGISKKPECQIPAFLGGVLIHIKDPSGNRSSTFSTLAYLCQHDDVPLILGYDRCLER